MRSENPLRSVNVPLGEDFPEIRDGVRRICADHPAPDWRDLDRRDAAAAACASVRDDFRFADHLAPACEVAAQQGGKLFR